MSGELYIHNGRTWVDMYDRFGLSLEDGALSALLTPPSLKESPKNESRLQNGAQYIASAMNTKVSERIVTLPCHITASGYDDLTSKLNTMLAWFSGGVVKIKTRYQPNVCYRLLYQSCTQFTQLFGGVAVFGLRFVEPNPANRSMP